jgi:tetratricopeptide (TPR) repeat protein
MPADPELVKAIVAADEALSDGNGSYLAGQVDDAQATLDRQAEIVAKLDYAPLSATYESLRGRIAMFEGDPIGGEQALERAFALAIRAGDDRRAALVARALAFELRERDRTSEASRWLMISMALAERLDDDSLHGEIELTRSQILAATGDYRGAEAAAQLAYELLGRARPNSARVGDALYLMAVAATRDGRHDEAIERVEQARSIWSSTIGPRHPQSVGAIGLLGVVARSKGDYAAAERHFRAALEIQQDTYGADHVEVTNHLVNLSIALADQGKLDEAIPLLERAIEIREAGSRPSPAWIGRSHVNLAQLQRRAGRLEPAIANLERGEAILREVLGEDHPDLITAIHIRGQLQLALGDLDRAELALDEALRRATLELGPEHLGVFEVSTDVARLALARGQPKRAEQHPRRGGTRGHQPQLHRRARVRARAGPRGAWPRTGRPGGRDPSQAGV